MVRDANTCNGELINQRRRQFIAALGASGVAGLAGCSGGDGDGGNGTEGGDDGGDGDDGNSSDGDDGGDGDDGNSSDGDDGNSSDGDDDGGDGSDVADVDATLTSYVTIPPADVTWGNISDWPVNARALCADVAATTDADDNIIPMAVEDWEYSADEVRFTVRDDANWSNGDPLLARHVFANHISSIFAAESRSTREELQEEGPQGTTDAITDLRIEDDGKTIYFLSEGGWFEEYDMDTWIETQIVGDWGEVEYHEDNGHYGLVAQRIIEEVDELRSEEGIEEAIAINEEEIPEDYQAPSEPEAGYDLVTAGAWQLDEVREDGLTLVPNENHYNADSINWETIELNIHPDPNARWTSLSEEIVDVDNGLNENPQPNVIRSFPDHLEYHAYNANTETLLFMPGVSQPFLENGRVRQAFAYAIDSERLAQVQHEQAASPLSEPPGLTREGTSEWIDDDLAESFQSYEYNTDRAAELLEGEGFTREDGTWITPDGDEWSLSLMARSGGSLSVNQGIMEDLNDFGIQIDLDAVEGTMFEDRYHGGEFNMALEQRDWSWEIYSKALTEEARRYKMGLWEHERVLEFYEENQDRLTRGDYGWTHLLGDFTDEDYQEFTVSAPPLGEPDADPTEEYPVAYYESALGEALSEDTRRDYVQRLAWVWNWRLPAIPLTKIANLAFMNHRDWVVPEDDAEWELGYPDPFSNLMNMGRVQADPEGNH